MPMKIDLGDKVYTKKPHPCGNHEFIIMRTGMDFRMKCTKCGKEVWITRVKLEKRIKRIERNEKE
ncbi:MAG: DUF951 domain-containing protein [Clostridiales bacterium]|jgi:hypothetical protein|nr:DUF951 domain-containing protein [Clostridiales bacterium]